MGKQSRYLLGRFSILFIILLSSVVLLFVSCGGGGGGSSSSTSSESTTTTYKLFNSEYFTAGSQETYNLTGSGTGGSYTGTLTLTTQAATTFDGAAAIPVDGEITFTSTTSVRSYTFKGIEYFNTDTSALTYLGFENDTFNDTTVSSKSVEVIPQTASIGDSATEGIYTFSSGNIETVTWKLTQASGGNANLNIVQTITDSTGSTTLYTQNYTFVIDKDGNRQSVTLELSEGGVSVTLSGDKT
jgi:hypothetical protein